MTLASIIIPSRGGATRLPRLLRALAAQTDPDWEAIVVLDGDIDDSQSVVVQYSHLPVRSIVFPENRGRVAALNAGLADAKGDVLIRCDDDLEPRVDYVAEHKTAHLGRPTGAIGAYLNVLPETPYARVYGRPADASHRSEAYALPRDQQWHYWAGNCSITRETYEKVGGYDPRYRNYGFEDVDYGYRLHLAGVDVHLIKELETPHFVAATTTKVRVKRAFHSGAARRTFDAIHGSTALGRMDDLDPSMWNRLVALIAKVSGLRTLMTLAGTADVAALVLPAPLSRKLIALLVEAGSLSGNQRPDQAGTGV